MSRSLRELYESSPFSSAEAPYVEEQYERFLDDPGSVSAEWREFFGQVGGGRLPSARTTAAKAMTTASGYGQAHRTPGTDEPAPCLNGRARAGRCARAAQPACVYRAPRYVSTSTSRTRNDRPTRTAGSSPDLMMR